MHEENCPNCKKELSLTPGNYPVASFYGPALCNCLGTIQTFPEIAKSLNVSTNIVEMTIPEISDLVVA